MNRVRRTLLSLPLIVAALLAAGARAQYAGATPIPPDMRPGIDAIKEIDIRMWLAYLAGKPCMGRGTGQEGFQKAAEYVAARFKEWGLKPVGDKGTYFQNVPFIRQMGDTAKSKITLGSTSLTGPASIGFQSVGADADLKGSFMFVKAVGTGTLEDPAVMEGKIVLVLDRSTGNGFRAQIFRGQPALVISVVDKLTNEGSLQIKRTGDQPQSRRFGGTNRLQVTPAAARKLMIAAGLDPNELNVSASTEQAASATATSKTVSATVKIQKIDVNVPNVVGLIEGSDPVLKGEVVGMGAHLDHLGTRGDVTYWGADDDGSGSCSLLALAKAFSVTPVKPKRSLLFMAFCGEEMGLLGSGYYSDNPIFPHDKMICELQMDMVGRNEQSQQEKPEDNVDTIHLVGSKRISMEFHDLVLQMNEHIGFKFEYDEEDVYTRSDHYNFAKHGIPIAFLFSGFHPDYHQPTDTIEKINFTKIANAARLNFLLAFAAANREKAFAKNGGN